MELATRTEIFWQLVSIASPQTSRPVQDSATRTGAPHSSNFGS